MLFTLLASITLAVTALLAWYLWRVPEGPACPRCGAATLADEHVVSNRASILFDRWTVARACPVCGWGGRQRRGGRPEPARHDGTSGGRS